MSRRFSLTAGLGMLCLPYTDRPFTGLFFVDCCFLPSKASSFLIQQASKNLVLNGKFFINKSTIYAWPEAKPQQVEALFLFVVGIAEYFLQQSGRAGIYVVPDFKLFLRYLDKHAVNGFLCHIAR